MALVGECVLFHFCLHLHLRFYVHATTAGFVIDDIMASELREDTNRQSKRKEKIPKYV